ncbi:hypothetical protein DICVIV_09000 [Dictyocaulus viviparus]|uniref:ABC transporter domain-containing protein n=1 Tax=Dictyocaulus viviparus TaxID=29172 RepID=A0A0D8XK41_DICVI|nr:hypothetical protein DICVIV_09000 [Dictyocaulus viviparus]
MFLRTADILERKLRGEDGAYLGTAVEVARYGIPSYYRGISAEPGSIFITANAILFGSYFFGLLGPHLMAIMKARMAAAIIYETIDAVQITSDNGEDMCSCEGRLEFRDVYFKYPTRENPVLRGINWVAEPGETIAFVGKSGCGKSTSTQGCVALPQLANQD